MSSCACMGPQNGEPLCPCQMTAARNYLTTDSHKDYKLAQPKHKKNDLICDRCGNTGEVEIAAYGTYIFEDCCCVPFREIINELKTEVQDLKCWIDKYCAQPPFTMVYDQFKINEIRANVAEQKLNLILSCVSDITTIINNWPVKQVVKEN